MCTISTLAELFVGSLLQTDLLKAQLQCINIVSHYANAFTHYIFLFMMLVFLFVWRLRSRTQCNLDSICTIFDGEQEEKMSSDYEEEEDDAVWLSPEMKHAEEEAERRSRTNLLLSKTGKSAASVTIPTSVTYSLYK